MAAYNVSNNTTTIKDMYQKLESDNWCIDKCLEFCNYENACIVQSSLILDKYYSYFKQYLIEVDVDSKYFYNPQRFANDYYGDPELDFLVLYFANINSLFDFNKEKIKVLDYAHLQDINKLFTVYKEQVKTNKENPTLCSSTNDNSSNSSAQYLTKK